MIRAFRDNDAAECGEIINACVATMDGLNEAARAFLYAKNVPDNVCEELQGFFSIVYEEEGLILALGSLDGYEIKRLYVHPDAQGQQIGTEILLALEEEAVRQAVDRLVVRSSPSAVGFYQRFGYETVDRDIYRLGQAEFEFVKMVKAMSPRIHPNRPE